MYRYGDVLQPWLTTAGHIASRPLATSFNLVLNSDGEQPPKAQSRGLSSTASSIGIALYPALWLASTPPHPRRARHQEPHCRTCRGRADGQRVAFLCQVGRLTQTDLGHEQQILLLLLFPSGQWLHVAKAWEALVNSPLYKENETSYSQLFKRDTDYLRGSAPADFGLQVMIGNSRTYKVAPRQILPTIQKKRTQQTQPTPLTIQKKQTQKKRKRKPKQPHKMIISN